MAGPSLRTVVRTVARRVVGTVLTTVATTLKELGRHLDHGPMIVALALRPALALHEPTRRRRGDAEPLSDLVIGQRERGHCDGPDDCR